MNIKWELEFGNNENMIFAYNILYENNPNFNPKFKTFTNAIRFIKVIIKIQMIMTFKIIIV